MPKRPIPAWVLAGGFLLAGNAGFLNAIALLGLTSQAVSHVTGALTRFGIDVESQNWEEAPVAGMMIASFLFGSIVCGFIIRDGELQPGRAYGAALLVESSLLFGAYFCLMANIRTGEYLAAAACGLQNALATTFSGLVIRSTNMTGLLTDFGSLLGRSFHLKRTDTDARHETNRRLAVAATLLGGFLVGAMYGGYAYREKGVEALLFAALGTTALGLLYIAWRRSGASGTRPPNPPPLA